MNENRFKGNWNQAKGEIKKKWAILTDDDLLHGEGNLDKLIGKIQQKTGEAEDSIKNFFAKLASHDGDRPSSKL